MKTEAQVKFKKVEKPCKTQVYIGDDVLSPYGENQIKKGGLIEFSFCCPLLCCPFKKTSLFLKRCHFESKLLCFGKTA